MLKGINEKIAIYEGSHEITYGNLKKEINRYSTLFEDLSGYRIAIFAENSLDWIYAFYAIWKNQNIPVPIDYMSGIDDVAFILNDCKPELIFCSSGREEVLKGALKEVDFEPRIIVFDKAEKPKKDFSSDIDFKFNDSDTAIIIYTSGTTGSPKGVMLSFENIISNMNAVSKDVVIFTPKERVLLLLPLHHVFPLLGSLVCPLFIGGAVALSPSLSSDDIIRTLHKYQVTMIIGVPRLYSLIRKGILEKINQSSIAKFLFKTAGILKSQAFSRLVFKSVHKKFGGHLHYMVSGGAPLDKDVAIDYRTLGFELLEGYGMTEAAPMITFTRPGKFKAGSAGHALPCTQIEIRDGEIVASGDNIMKGYYNRSSETKEILKDGWLYTGDLGYIDKKGYVFITGRKKEILVLSNGKNINPVEIENKIESISPLIKEAAVLMVNDKLNLIIVPDEKEMLKENVKDPEKYFKENILKKYNEKASSSKRLLKMHIIYQELPRTRLSKIQRFKLADIIENPAVDNQLSKIEKADSEELQSLMDFLSKQIDQPVFPGDLIQEELSLDSLSRISLIVFLESNFGIDMSERQLSDFVTVRELGNYIINNKNKHKNETVNWAKILKPKINFTLPKAGISFKFANWSYRAVLHSFFRLKKEGEANIPEGPFIMAANHQSFLDGFLLGSVLKQKIMRSTYFYAKEKHWKTSFSKFLARKNNIILMDINQDVKLSIQKMAEVLKKGKNIVIFPEGTRSENGKLSSFKQTFAILAAELNVPVIPVAIQGAYEAMPVGSSFPRLFRKISVKFLAPVYPDNMSYDTLKEKVQNLLAKQLS